MRVIKARRTQATLVRGEQPAERGVHAQVATPRLGKARDAAVAVAPGPSCLHPWSLPAHRPPSSAPARDAHALRPPLKGPVHSRRVLRLPRPSLRSRLPLGWGWAFAWLSPVSTSGAKRLQSCGGSLLHASGAQTPGRFRARKARGWEFLEGCTLKGPQGVETRVSPGRPGF